jgi:hypothetical protein
LSCAVSSRRRRRSATARPGNSRARRWPPRA